MGGNLPGGALYITRNSSQTGLTQPDRRHRRNFPLQRPWTSNPRTKPGRRQQADSHGEQSSFKMGTREIPEENFQLHRNESNFLKQSSNFVPDDTRISVGSYLTGQNLNRAQPQPSHEKKRRSYQVGTHLRNKSNFVPSHKTFEKHDEQSDTLLNKSQNAMTASNTVEGLSQA